MPADRQNNEGEGLFRQAKEYAAGSARFIRDTQKALEAFIEAHQKGNIKGTFGFALACFEGNGPERDRDKAEELVAGIIPAVERRAGEGEPDYQLILGDMYSFGLGKPTDFARAFSLYTLAAEQGNLEAQCNLGYTYLVGQGVELDASMAVHWWLKSAEAGYAHSCHDIGECYLNGNGVTRDQARAIFWFQKASELNYSHGTSYLAYCHLFGIGVEQDVGLATELYNQAYKQDHRRTYRDLLAANIDADLFVNEGTISVTEIRSVTEVPESEYRTGRYFVRASVEELDPGAFTHCSTLFKFLVDNRNHCFCCIDGVLYSDDRKELIRYPNGKEDVEFICPPFVERIGNHAFQNARHLLKVELSEGLLEIGESAFDDCKSLVQVRFHGELAAIGPWAFHGCDAISEFRLPATLRNIGKYAFGSCESLSKIEMDQANMSYSTIDDCLFDRERKHLLQYAIGQQHRRLEIPRTVEVIGFRCCSDAYYLEEVVINKRVVEVQDKAFYFCTDLKRVYFRGPPVVKLGSQVFDQTHDDLKIVVPAALLGAYQRDERFSGLNICPEG